MNVILQNIRSNRVIALRQLIDEILSDEPTCEVKSTLLEIRFYVEKLNKIDDQRQAEPDLDETERIRVAAPELLAALIRIRDGAGSNPGFEVCGCDDHGSSDCCNFTTYCCPECIASAAISKAEAA